MKLLPVLSLMSIGWGWSAVAHASPISHPEPSTPVTSSLVLTTIENPSQVDEFMENPHRGGGGDLPNIVSPAANPQPLELSHPRFGLALRSLQGKTSTPSQPLYQVATATQHQAVLDLADRSTITFHPQATTQDWRHLQFVPFLSHQSLTYPASAYSLPTPDQVDPLTVEFSAWPTEPLQQVRDWASRHPIHSHDDPNNPDFLGESDFPNMEVAQEESETEFPQLSDPDANTDDANDAVGDPELGILRLQELPLSAPPAPPVLYFFGRLNFLSSDNIFLAAEPSRVNDRFLSPAISLVAFPALGPNTYLLASVNASLVRYQTLPTASYDNLNLELGIRQQIFPATYAQFTLGNQRLFEPGFNTQFFNEYSARISVDREDRLLPNLTLNSSYQAQITSSDPVTSSRFIQQLGLALAYDISSSFTTSAIYQLTLADYTQQDRYDTYNQVFGVLTYHLSPSTRLNVFGGLSFGRSSNEAINFSDTLYGINLEVGLPLF